MVPLKIVATNKAKNYAHSPRSTSNSPIDDKSTTIQTFQDLGGKLFTQLHIFLEYNRNFKKYSFTSKNSNHQTMATARLIMLEKLG